MTRMIQIRNVPEALHRELKVRAARDGRSLSEYLLRELERFAARPTADDVLERIRRRGPVHVTEAPAQAVRAERDARP